MALCNFVVEIKVKYPRLLFWLNAPVVLLGFKPVVPRCFVSVSEPKAVKL